MRKSIFLNAWIVLCWVDERKKKKSPIHPHTKSYIFPIVVINIIIVNRIRNEKKNPLIEKKFNSVVVSSCILLRAWWEFSWEKKSGVVMSREREKEGKILYMDKNEYNELEGGWYPTFQQSFDWLIIYSIECLLSLFTDKRIDRIKVIHIYRLTDDSLMLINPTG